MSLVIQGYLTPQRLIMQGFTFGAITLIVSPANADVAPNAVVVFTADRASNWNTPTGGVLVVAGDNLSATWTAPGTAGAYSFTVTDQANPGNKVTIPLLVLGGGDAEFGDFVHSTPQLGGAFASRSIVRAA